MEGSVNISSSDSNTFTDFDEGNSVQVRVKVSEKEQTEYEKGKMVKVAFEGKESRGKIVSDPIVIDDKSDPGKKTLSLIIEKK
jgi:hypothetical protein